MKPKKASSTTQPLPIMNIDELIIGGGGAVRNKRYGDLFSNTVRAIMAGGSGCGKTNVMLTLLFSPNGLRFENVYVYSKSLYQPKYELLKRVLERTKEVKYFPYEDNEAALDPSEARPNSVFIFDDVACDKQDKIRAYFSMGRHKNVGSFYLCRTYARVPKHLIRDNANCIVLFRQDEVNLKQAYDEHVTTDMSFDRFKELCSRCWRDSRHDIMVIMKDFDIAKDSIDI